MGDCERSYGVVVVGGAVGFRLWKVVAGGCGKRFLGLGVVGGGVGRERVRKVVGVVWGSHLPN